MNIDSDGPTADAGYRSAGLVCVDLATIDHQ